MRYLVQHKNCGGLLFKTETAILFNTQIRCSRCRNIVKIPEEITITLEKKKRSGLEKSH